jgi:7-cyano-7-deazaguanine synthase
MNRLQALSRLPNNCRALVIVSGGLDSTIALRLTVEKYGKNNVKAITFDYGQKQSIEISHAMESCEILGVAHEVINASFLAEISMGFSANVDPNIAVPDIKEVLGDPQPKTYVPNRNMILLSIAAAYAETQNLNVIVCGLQVHDLYGYYDTSQRFVDKLNSVLEENRKFKIKIISPFSDLSKAEELSILKQLDGNIQLARSTFTCYNPINGVQCGKCAACSERIMNFARFGTEDPQFYDIDINWSRLIEKEKQQSAQ